MGYKQIRILSLVLITMLISTFACGCLNNKDRNSNNDDRTQIPVLCVLCDFKDAKISTTTSDWERLLFGDNGSLRDYYLKNTNNKISLKPHIINENKTGIIKVNIDEDLREVSSKITMGSNLDNYYRYEIYEQIEDVISDYAGNTKDITNDPLKIMVVLPAYQAASVPIESSELIKFYDWTMPLCYEKGIKTYANFVSELSYCPADLKMQAPLGTLLHEFGHLFCLPDMYAKNAISRFGAGYLTSMSWGYKTYETPGAIEGIIPVNLDAYSKTELGIKPETITASGIYTLCSQDTGKYNILKINISKNEYYLLENRTFEGYDRYLANYVKSPGVAIWHIKSGIMQDASDKLKEKLEPVYVIDENGIDLMEANEKILGYAVYDMPVNYVMEWPYFNETCKNITDNDILFHSDNDGNASFESKDGKIKIEVVPSGDAVNVKVALTNKSTN